MELYVAIQGQQKGPISFDEVKRWVSEGELKPSDYYYSFEKEDWLILSEHPELGDAVMKEYKKYKESQVAKPDKPMPEAVSPQEAEWYVLKGENKFGPFAYTDIVKMLQEKSVYEYDYVWNPCLTTWQRIAELDEFSPEQIRGLKNSGKAEISEIFFRRRHARIDHESSIVVHDNRHVWRGQSMEVSAGGAGLVIENAMLQPGQILYLHFKPADGLPPFNAVCEVVSKAFSREAAGKKDPIKYGVKFTKLNNNTQKSLQEYTQGAKPEAA